MVGRLSMRRFSGAPKITHGDEVDRGVAASIHGNSTGALWDVYTEEHHRSVAKDTWVMKVILKARCTREGARWHYILAVFWVRDLDGVE